jgi:glycosyltransferase involved in cell wall biosynthesis
MTKLSLVIPALNEEKFLPHLLTSLTKQTKQDFEIVVVDGLSKDHTVEIARSFYSKLPKLNVIVSEKAGLPLQRNLGARATTGEWLVFIDADSVLLPYFVERLEWFIEKQKPVIFTSWFRPDSETSGDALFTLLSNSFVEGSVYFHRPIAPGPLTAVKRDVFELVGGYNEALTFGEDYDFTCRVVDRGNPLQILRETLYEYSLRRVRREGKLCFVSLYATAALRVLLTKKNIEQVPSYVMGGHLYETNSNLAEQSMVHE